MIRTFFTDRDLGQQFPNILRAAGLTVVRHSDLFPQDASDEQWLERVGADGWIAVTHDRRIRYKPNELKAVDRHRVGLLSSSARLPFPRWRRISSLRSRASSRSSPLRRGRL